MLENGATTLWERWELLTGTGMNSYNHPMHGSVDAWFYRWIAGMTIAKTKSLSPHFVFRISIFQEITSARATLQTRWGKALVSWRRDHRQLTVDLCVPWNCTATLHLPNVSHELNSGQHRFSLELTPQQVS